MLGNIVRGLFLIGVLGWYSQSVWHMIDGYFRDQFQKYLHEEFAKNPKIRADIKAYSGHADKSEIPITDRTKQQKVEVGIAETFQESLPDGMIFEEFGTENGAATDKRLAGKQQPAGSEDKLGPSEDTSGVAETPAANQISVPHTAEELNGKDTLKKQKLKWLPKKIEEKESHVKGKKKKHTVKLLTLTEADFLSARKSKDYDFSKFEMEEDDDEDSDQQLEEGILVSKLPYKPRLDLGGLQRIHDDEFCPLSPEDEITCGDTMTWP